MANPMFNEDRVQELSGSGRMSVQGTVLKTGLLLLLLFGAIAIWAQELRTLALSFVAIAAAIVVATKELLMCLSGTLLRSSSRNVSLGDRVEIAGVRGAGW